MSACSEIPWFQTFIAYLHGGERIEELAFRVDRPAGMIFGGEK